MNFDEVRRGWEQAAKSPDRERAIARSVPPENFEASGRAAAAHCVLALPPRLYPAIVEIGCGTGRITKWLAAYYNLVYAVDISETMVEHLKARELPNVRGVVDDGTGFEVDARAAYSYTTLMHNTRAGVWAMFAHLHQQGFERVAFQLPVYERPVKVSTWRDVAQWPADEVEAMLEETGWRVETLWTNPGSYDKRLPETIGPNHFRLHVVTR